MDLDNNSVDNLICFKRTDQCPRGETKTHHRSPSGYKEEYHINLKKVFIASDWVVRQHTSSFLRIADGYVACNLPVNFRLIIFGATNENLHKQHRFDIFY